MKAPGLNGFKWIILLLPLMRHIVGCIQRGTTIFETGYLNLDTNRTNINFIPKICNPEKLE